MLLPSSAQFKSSFMRAYRDLIDEPKASPPSTFSHHKSIYLQTEHMSSQQILRASHKFKVIFIAEVHNTAIHCFCGLLMHQGKSWFDAVQIQVMNPALSHIGETKLRRRKCGNLHTKRSPNGSELKYEPDYFRFFAKVLMIFSHTVETDVCDDLSQSSGSDGETECVQCWMFLEYLEGAHPGNYKHATWQSKIIPNWPHVRQVQATRGRFDWKYWWIIRNCWGIIRNLWLKFASGM